MRQPQVGDHVILKLGRGEIEAKVTDIDSENKATCNWINSEGEKKSVRRSLEKLTVKK